MEVTETLEVDSKEEEEAKHRRRNEEVLPIANHHQFLEVHLSFLQSDENKK